MPVETQIEHIPLSKHRLLEFLEGRKGPVTAKVASIDLDTRASTVRIPKDIFPSIARSQSIQSCRQRANAPGRLGRSRGRCDSPAA